ncbi:MAG: methionine adenosyltransferase, partial [Candidatus Micrarchaeia archaeon]
MANTSVSQRFSVPIESQYTEIVERKGIGHPDSLIDGIMEKVSVELSKTYLEKFGTILHHNVDKGLIVGGTSDATFGSGKIITPIEVILAGRATREYNNSIIDVDNIAVNAARSYLQEHTRFLDLDNEVKFQSKILKGSSDLNHIFARGNGVPLSNDTSFGVGFAPLSETERIVLETERFLNGSYYKQRMPAIGEDIKVMGVRDGDNITLTVAIA